MTEWYLILMIWGDTYSDADCNRLIINAFGHAPGLKGAVVLTDRLDRKLDPRAIISRVPTDFDRSDFKTGGLPIKISMFEIDVLPEGASCVYVDLDSAIIGDLGKIAKLTETGPFWTLRTPRSPFNWWSRMLWRLSKGRRFGAGNSSVFAFRNKFSGNPTQKFRDKTPIFGHFNAGVQNNDDRFIGWSCQDLIRPIPSNLAVRFRIEFLEVNAVLNWIKGFIRRGPRQQLVIVTFDGPRIKPSVVTGLCENDKIVDHHGRTGRWTDHEMSGIRTKIQQALQNQKS